jgi:hypothetical protein
MGAYGNKSCSNCGSCRVLTNDPEICYHCGAKHNSVKEVLLAIVFLCILAAVAIFMSGVINVISH